MVKDKEYFFFFDRDLFISRSENKEHLKQVTVSAQQSFAFFILCIGFAFQTIGYRNISTCL